LADGRGKSKKDGRTDAGLFMKKGKGGPGDVVKKEKNRLSAYLPEKNHAIGT